ncbi:MAG: M20/M25/M40 family metallo-hydrolase [Candidatus Aminicenantes bacterium]|nr:M20/M25/M40 family metallo-hydrolase [Candidatus Aminicenantes bacterium]
MRKTIVFLIILSLFSFSVLIGQQKKEEKKPDPMENLSIVTDPQPVPESKKVGFDSITGKDAVTYLTFLASDSLQGRDTATLGYDIAAEYVASMFTLWGIKPAGDFMQPTRQRRFMMQSQPQTQKPKRGYFQNIVFREVLSNEGMVCVEWKKGNQRKTRTFYSNVDYSYSASGTQSFTAPVVFVGYGIQEESLKLDEYKNLNVKGKIVVMLTETPGKGDPKSPFNKGELKNKYYPPRRMRRMVSPKIQLAKKMGAVAVISIENSPKENLDVAERAIASQKINDEQPIFPGSRRRLSLIQGKTMPMPWDGLPNIRISREMADIVLGFVGQDIETLKGKIEKTLKSHSMVLTGVTFTLKNKAKTKLVSSPNVLGYIEGSDPVLKDEVVVIGAHLDHLGMRGDYIFNGADDNGSGSVGVMEIAEAFIKNPVKPKRSILFALWTGEEKGLLGSRYYVTNPSMPFNKTVACLNLDMISREWSEERLKMMSRMFGRAIDDKILKQIKASNFISISLDSNSPELADILKKNNQYVGLSLNLRKSESAMGGSDHAPFAMKKIPWVFFSAAITEDYHQPSDSVQKISKNLMEKIIRLTYLTAFGVADK